MYCRARRCGRSPQETPVVCTHRLRVVYLFTDRGLFYLLAKVPRTKRKTAQQDTAGDRLMNSITTVCSMMVRRTRWVHIQNACLSCRSLLAIPLPVCSTESTKTFHEGSRFASQMFPTYLLPAQSSRKQSRRSLCIQPAVARRKHYHTNYQRRHKRGGGGLSACTYNTSTKK